MTAWLVPVELWTRRAVVLRAFGLAFRVYRQTESWGYEAVRSREGRRRDERLALASTLDGRRTPVLYYNPILSVATTYSLALLCCSNRVGDVCHPGFPGAVKC